MKLKIVLLTLICSLMLVSCGSHQGQKNLAFSEADIVYEEPNIQTPHIVIVFDYVYDFEKPSDNSGLSLKELQDQLKQDRKNAKEFYIKKNTEYLNQLDLNFESRVQAKVSISNYTNIVFIRFAGYVVEDDVKDMVNYLNSKEFVKSSYFNKN